jgi:hypothetical protein
MSEDVLKKFSSNTNILKFNEDGEISGIYKKVYEEDDPFSKDGGKRLIYLIKSDDDNKEKQLSSTSKRLARAMYESGANFGDHITIMRFGEKYETAFKVKVSAKEQVTETEEAVPDIAADF